ncbi:MAG: YraN family protein [Pseudomonadota bacterium]
MSRETDTAGKPTANGDRVARYASGRRAEWLAAGVMIARGYRLLALRHRTPVGELDLVAKRGRRIAFVEVKQRATRDAALFAVTARNRQRVVAASEHWLARHARRFDGVRGYDIVAVVPGPGIALGRRRFALPRVHYLKDAFLHSTT